MKDVNKHPLLPLAAQYSPNDEDSCRHEWMEECTQTPE